MALDVAAPAKDDESGVAGGDLQQHLQLEACDGKYLTRQEILLLELFQSFHQVRARRFVLLSLTCDSRESESCRLLMVSTLSLSLRICMCTRDRTAVRARR